MGSTVRGLFTLALFALGPLVVFAALRLGFDPVAHEASLPLIHRDGGFVCANACRASYEAHFDSWERTFHHTMTQRADASTVVGAFDGGAVSYTNMTAQPIARDGRFFMELPSPDGKSREAEVVLAVGSRRYQQYFERIPRGDGFAFVRLPIPWHIEAQRWLHLNTVFLNPDSTNWDDHKADWNSNCIFCHNTWPQPRMTNYANRTSKPLSMPSRSHSGGGWGPRICRFACFCGSRRSGCAAKCRPTAHEWQALARAAKRCLARARMSPGTHLTRQRPVLRRRVSARRLAARWAVRGGPGFLHDDAV